MCSLGNEFITVTNQTNPYITIISIYKIPTLRTYVRKVEVVCKLAVLQTVFSLTMYIVLHSIGNK